MQRPVFDKPPERQRANRFSEPARSGGTKTAKTIVKTNSRFLAGIDPLPYDPPSSLRPNFSRSRIFLTTGHDHAPHKLLLSASEIRQKKDARASRNKPVAHYWETGSMADRDTAPIGKHASATGSKRLPLPTPLTDGPEHDDFLLTVSCQATGLANPVASEPFRLPAITGNFLHPLLVANRPSHRSFSIHTPVLAIESALVDHAASPAATTGWPARFFYRAPAGAASLFPAP